MDGQYNKFEFQIHGWWITWWIEGERSGKFGLWKLHHPGSWLVSRHPKAGRPQLCAWGEFFVFQGNPWTFLLYLSISKKSLKLFSGILTQIFIWRGKHFLRTQSGPNTTPSPEQNNSSKYILWIFPQNISSESSPGQIRPRTFKAAARVHHCPLPLGFCCHWGRGTGQCGAHTGNQVHCLIPQILIKIK